MTIPLLLSWQAIYKPRKYCIYVASSLFVLLFYGFDTFCAQGKMRKVCRTLAIHTLPSYLILNKVMLDQRKRHASKESQPWLALFWMHHLPVAMMFS